MHAVKARSRSINLYERNAPVNAVELGLSHNVLELTNRLSIPIKIAAAMRHLEGFFVQLRLPQKRVTIY